MSTTAGILQITFKSITPCFSNQQKAMPFALMHSPSPSFTLCPSDYLIALGNLVIERSDKELIALFLEGNFYSFNDLVAKHFKRVWFIARRYTDTLEEATDVTQDGLLKAYHKIHMFKHQSAFSTWLHRLILNNAHDLYDKRKNNDSNLTIDSDYVNKSIEVRMSHDPTEQLELSLTLEPLIAALPHAQQTSLFLVDFMGYDVTTAAESLHVQPGTIKSRRSRARDSMRTQLMLEGPPTSHQNITIS